jgi:hypothetical protein
VPVSADPNGVLSSVSCASPRFCVAVGSHGGNYGDPPSDGYAFAYNGHTWRIVGGASEDGGFTSVSCAKTNDRVVGDHQGNVLRCDPGCGGLDNLRNSSDPVGPLVCPRDSFCIACLDTLSSIYNGRAWSPLVPAGYEGREGGAYPRAMSCAATNFCVAVGGQDSLYFDGTDWNAPATIDRGNKDVTSVSCPTTTFCVAVDSNDRALIHT